MKEKIEILLKNPDLTMLQHQHLYQELSCVEVLRKFLGTLSLDDRLDSIWRIEEILHSIKIETYDEQDKKTEEIC